MQVSDYGRMITCVRASRKTSNVNGALTEIKKGSSLKFQNHSVASSPSFVMLKLQRLKITAYSGATLEVVPDRL